MVKDPRELKVYKPAFEASMAIHQMSLKFPKIEQFELASQIRRASKSVCANIVEGYVRQHASKPEFSRFLIIAAGSAKEVLVWLDYAYNLKYINEKDYNLHSVHYEKIFQMLMNFRKNLTN